MNEIDTTIQNRPDFNGKTVAFRLSKPSMLGDDNLLLDSIRFQEQGNRLFVIGHSIQTKWANSQERKIDIEIGIAWDEVVYYSVFASREDYLGPSHYLPDEKPVVRKGKSFAGIFVAVVSVGILVCVLVALVLWILKMVQAT